MALSRASSPIGRNSDGDLLYNFQHKCMNRNFTVSLKEKKGLYTFIPDKPMNFWLYKREHAKDKAPVKERDAYAG